MRRKVALAWAARRVREARLKQRSPHEHNGAVRRVFGKAGEWARRLVPKKKKAEGDLLFSSSKGTTSWYDYLIEDYIYANDTGKEPDTHKRKVPGRMDNPHTKKIRELNKALLDAKEDLNFGSKFVDGHNDEFEACLYDSWKKKYKSTQPNSVYRSWEVELGGTASVSLHESWRGTTSGQFGLYNRTTQTLLYAPSGRSLDTGTKPMLTLRLACTAAYTAYAGVGAEDPAVRAAEGGSGSEEESWRRGEKLDFVADVQPDGEKCFTATYYTPCACTPSSLDTLRSAVTAFETQRADRGNVLVGRTWWGIASSAGKKEEGNSPHKGGNEKRKEREEEKEVKRDKLRGDL